MDFGRYLVVFSCCLYCVKFVLGSGVGEDKLNQLERERERKFEMIF